MVYIKFNSGWLLAFLPLVRNALLHHCTGPAQNCLQMPDADPHNKPTFSSLHLFTPILFGGSANWWIFQDSTGHELGSLRPCGQALGTRMRLNFTRLCAENCSSMSSNVSRQHNFIHCSISFLHVFREGSSNMTSVTQRKASVPGISRALALGLLTFLARPTFCPAESVKCTGGVKVVSRERLFVSEPDPQWFGNGPNPNFEAPEAQNWTNANWLKSLFHFNFAEYGHGPANFGVLRVMNDDLVQPRRGFGAHPHRDMEILTFILHGRLTHKDSTGTQETLGRGGLQYMTAGSGVLHSEQNLHDEPLRFIQCWVLPRQRGLKPRYGSMAGDAAATASRLNQWSHIVSDVAAVERTPVKINQVAWCKMHQNTIYIYICIYIIKYIYDIVRPCLFCFLRVTGSTGLFDGRTHVRDRQNSEAGAVWGL